MKLFRISTVPVSLNILLKGQLQFLSQYYDVTAIASDEDKKRWNAIAEEENVRCHPISMNRNISLSKDLISLIKLYKYFKKEKPDIVHSITPKAGLLSMVAAKMAGVPIRMHTFTGLIFPTKTGALQKVLIFTDKILCACATNVYPEGEGVKKDLETFKITKKPLKVLANGNVNGINISFFNPDLFNSTAKKELQKKLDIAKDDFVFIFVGRMVTDKGINELIKAFNIVSQKHEQVKLLLVGRFETELDPLKAETLDLINENKKIITTGYQADVRPFFAISDCLVFPSYREGFPNVVMQAGAMKLPAIVTNINGCNEIIIEGVNGNIIPVKNVEALHEKMELYIQNKSLYQQLKNNTRDMITSRYEQKSVWEALLKEYKSLEKIKR